MQSVMIIDDSEADQFFAKLEIAKFDSSISVLQAYDGFQAIETLEKLGNPPDVIFLDINMPRMSGHEFLDEYVKKFQKTSVVVMLSSSSLDVDKDRALAFDCVRDYIEKPLDAAYLSRVSELLEK